MKKTLASLAVVAAVLSTPAHSAFMDFTIEEGSVPGANPNEIVGDKLNGGYNEIYTIVSDLSGNLSFSSKAYADIGLVFANEGADAVATQIGPGTFGADFQYQVYALFDAVGDVTVSGSDVLFNGTGGMFELYIDVNSDTSKALAADGYTDVVLGNNVDDYLIASSTNLDSLVNVLGNPGAFDLYFDDLTLTSGDQNATFAGDQNGEDYFVKPAVFYTRTNVDGDFDNITFADIAGDLASNGSFTTSVTGDVSAVFVPVPAPLALFGLGLLGLGWAKRRA